jgi:hypothetical protein
MHSYDFEVRRGESVEYSSKSVILENLAGVWAMVQGLSKRFGAPGSRVVVRDHNGGIVISVGVAAALRMKGTSVEVSAA